MATKTGREREALEIVRYKKAALVGQLLLAELSGPMRPISVEEYVRKPRKELISERDNLRASLRGEIAKFCRSNFQNVEPEDLVSLYDVLLEHDSEWFRPRAEFEKEFGRLKAHVLKGAPLHSTVRITPSWGLQVEYPEHHLVRDIAVCLNEAIDIEEDRLTPYRTKSLQEQKQQETRSEIADLIRRRNANQRACVLSCFNLIEAYINGLAWDYVQTNDISGLTEKNRNVLTETKGFVNIIDKLIKIPALVAGKETGPLHQTRDPLKSFIETVKPHRDAIVHPSPFAASERFGGYDKLSKLYGLSLHTVREAVDITIALIKTIRQFVDGVDELPSWFPTRAANGKFVIPPSK